MKEDRFLQNDVSKPTKNKSSEKKSILTDLAVKSGEKKRKMMMAAAVTLVVSGFKNVWGKTV